MKSWSAALRWGGNVDPSHVKSKMISVGSAKFLHLRGLQQHGADHSTENARKKKKKTQANPFLRYPWNEDDCFGVTFNCGMTGNSEPLKSAVHQAVRAETQSHSKASTAERRATTRACCIQTLPPPPPLPPLPPPDRAEGAPAAKTPVNSRCILSSVFALPNKMQLGADCV